MSDIKNPLLESVDMARVKLALPAHDSARQSAPDYGPLACRHGTLRRSCEICDLEADCARLTAENAELRSLLSQATNKMAFMVQYGEWYEAEELIARMYEAVNRSHDAINHNATGAGGEG